MALDRPLQGRHDDDHHRRFYPGDVNATVAYVAPNDAVGSDDVYDEFQANVGGAAYADCRADLVAAQRRILEDRAWFRSRLADHGKFTTIGGPDRALEVAVVELYFAFWQYQPAAGACDDVPGPDATRRQVWTWVDVVFGWSYVSDRGVRPYTPYYFQAATQLGAPAPYEDEIADLLHHPGHDVAASFVPDRLDPLTFHPAAMADVDQWVRTSASRMLFVYGEFDPRSSGARTPGQGSISGSIGGSSSGPLSPRADRLAGMPTYVAFLRAINLGPNRKFAKADIVAATEAAGGTDVETYINTGNVLLTTPLRSRAKVQAALEKAYGAQAGFVVPTIVFTAAELATIGADAEELTRPGLERHYLYLLQDAPAAGKVKALLERDGVADQVVVRGRAAHFLLGEGYIAGKVDPWGIEKALGVVATNRNFNVVTTLARKWCS